MNDFQYMLKASSNELTFLFPLTSIIMILSKDDARVIYKNPNEIEYKDQTYALVSMSEMLLRKDKIVEDYLLLMQCEQKRIAVSIANVDSVISIGGGMYELPTYLPKQAYITNCIMLEDGKLAYLINVMELMTKM